MLRAIVKDFNFLPILWVQNVCFVAKHLHSSVTLQLSGHLENGLLELSKQGCNVKFKDYEALLDECIRERALRGGQRVQAHMLKTQYLPPMYLRTRLIVLYVKCEVLRDARIVFDEMPQKNVVSWTAMISGYGRNGSYSEAMGLFVQMLRSGMDPNEFTFSSLLTSCTGSSEFEYGRQIHSLIVKSPFEFHVYIGSSLVDLYAKAGRIKEAMNIFEDLPEKDAVTCAAVISGYAQLGLDKEALELFCRLQREGMAANHVTYASILTALAGLTVFEYGRQVHGCVLRSDLSLYVAVQNSLIDMYSKCGNLLYARRIFDNMPERTVVSWNAMLAGYSKNGVGKAVVDLYMMMRGENKLKPDSTTLLSVLSGCSHGGMENSGLKFFEEIVSGIVDVELSPDHYACVVDMLGRAGYVDRAFQFIKEMPFRPNASVWKSLLGACRVHHDVGIGKIAGDQLLEMEPENSGNYVDLCSLYARDGKWDEVKKLRKAMKENCAVKQRGRSWIEFNQSLHAFCASI